MIIELGLELNILLILLILGEWNLVERLVYIFYNGVGWYIVFRLLVRVLLFRFVLVKGKGKNVVLKLVLSRKWL